jgi:hypothetical protein
MIAGHEHSTVRKIHPVLSAVFTRAVRVGSPPRPPCPSGAAARGRAYEPPNSEPFASAGDRVTKLGYSRHGHHLRGDVDGEPPGADGCQ